MPVIVTPAGVKVDLVAVTRRIARRFRIQDHREVLGAAWEGVTKAVRRRPNAPFRSLFRKATQAVIDHMWEFKINGLSRHHYRRGTPFPVSLSALRPNDARLSARGDDGPPTPGQLWGEERERRLGVGERERLVAYLFYVEALPRAEIAAALRVSEPRVSQLLRAFRDGVAAGKKG